jgi:formate hydrogenlyase subunit 5
VILMETLQEKLSIILKHKIDEYTIITGANNELYITSLKKDPRTLLELLYYEGFTLINLFGVENFQKQKGLMLFYVLEKNDFPNFFIVQSPISGQETFSVSDIYPSACWFQRGITDGFGVSFTNAFDTRRLFLHDMYPASFHPLRKTKDEAITLKETVAPEEEYQFKKVNGEGVYMIPVGPVHAGIIEPGHFRFSVIGETIFNLEVRLFYKHRGIEKLAEHKTPDDCVKIAEAISGDETVANAVAFCIGVEKISEIEIPKRALLLRTIFMELERIYSHLSDLAGMIIDVAAPVYASPFFVLREELFRYNDTLTDSRFLRGIIGLGGLKKDVDDEQLKRLHTYLSEFLIRFDNAIHEARNFPLIVDRMEKTGVIKRGLIKPLALSGPTARASGASVDTRIHHPYGYYPFCGLKERINDSGDVLSRFDVKTSEIKDSANLLIQLIEQIPSGPVYTKGQISDGYALSVVESARGQNVHWISIRKGVIDRYSIRTASFCNWQAIEHAVLDCIVADFPLINKSLNLSYAGTDL